MNKATKELRYKIGLELMNVYEFANTKEYPEYDIYISRILKLLKDMGLKFVSSKLPTNEYISKDFESLIEEIDIE